MAEDGKRQRIDPPSAWCTPVTASTHPIAPRWTFNPPPAQQSTPVPSQLPAFNMPPMRPTSPPRFFFPEDALDNERSPAPPLERPPPRDERFMKFRDPKFPLAGIMREEGGVLEWMAANKKRENKTDK